MAQQRSSHWLKAERAALHSLVGEKSEEKEPGARENSRGSAVVNEMEKRNERS